MTQQTLLLLWGKQILGLVLVSFLLSILSLAQPLYMLNLYDRVLSSQSTETLLSITFIAFFVILCYGMFDRVRSLLQNQMGNSIEERIRPQLLEISIRLAAVGGDKLAKRRLAKLEELKAFITSSSFSSLFDLAFVPVYFSALYFFHPIVFVVCLALALGTVCLALISEWAVRQTLADYWIKKAELRDHESQLTRNAAETVPLGRLKNAIIALVQKESDAERVISRAHNSFGRAQTINKTVTMLIQTLVLGVACYLVLKREVSVGVMFAVNIVATRAMQPLFQITTSFRSYTKAADGWRDISKDLASFEQNSTSAQPLTEGILRVRSLMILDRIQDRKILNNINIDVDPGELVVVTGESGAGKSTLLKAIVGLIPDYVGRVELDRREIKHWRFERDLSFIGYLPQSVNLFGVSIAENITGGGGYDYARLVELCEQVGIHQEITGLKDGYETIINEASPQFSGGQVRMIGLARALWGNPKLIVVDEPTSGLDVARERAVLELLCRQQSKNVSILVSSHSSAFLRASTKILWLKQGFVKSYGFRDDVLRKMTNPEAA